MTGLDYEIISLSDGKPIYAWTHGVLFDEGSRRQLENVARLPFIYRWVAAMPDVHAGIGAAIGAVIPTRGAVIPSAVGVDIGCGLLAVRTGLTASALPDNLTGLRSAVEKNVPHGRTHGGRRNDRGAWGQIPDAVVRIWNSELAARYRQIIDRHKKIAEANSINHLGTLGTGNHFIEVSLDEEERIWLLLHSGSRGVGNKIGTYFIDRARERARRQKLDLPDRDLAYFREGEQDFIDYLQAAEWAQKFARVNRGLMMEGVVRALGEILKGAAIEERERIDCHHNYVNRERHFDQDVYVTRKGAVSARSGQLGIIPGSMGAATYIVRGRGNELSFQSCSHGAGRSMSRREAKRTITLEDHARATRGVECRRDRDVLDESPAAYKPIDRVMSAQQSLVEIVHTLRQVVCVKG